jgi:hypothetical protein
MGKCALGGFGKIGEVAVLGAPRIFFPQIPAEKDADFRRHANGKSAAICGVFCGNLREIFYEGKPEKFNSAVVCHSSPAQKSLLHRIQLKR